jgi:hypothetical protein
MKPDDLAPFADCAGLRARMLENPGRLSDDERVELLDRARHTLAATYHVTLEDAARAMFEFGSRGDLEVRSGSEFAAVFLFGRVLQVATRHELRGACHPEFN